MGLPISTLGILHDEHTHDLLHSDSATLTHLVPTACGTMGNPREIKRKMAFFGFGKKRAKSVDAAAAAPTPVMVASAPPSAPSVPGLTRQQSVMDDYGSWGDR